MKAKDMIADGIVTANPATLRGMTVASATAAVAVAVSGTSLADGPIVARVTSSSLISGTTPLVEIPCPRGIFVDVGAVDGGGGVTVYYD